MFGEAFRGLGERWAAEPAVARGIPKSFLPIYVQDFVQRNLAKYMELGGPLSLDDLNEVRQVLTGAVEEALEEELGPLLREDDEDTARIDDSVFARIRELEDSPMLLTVNGEPVACPPTEAQIDECLRSLSGIPPSFVILSQSRMSYIQAGGSASGGFDLEYQVGMLEYHYRCTNERLDLATVARALKLYLHRDERWKTGLDWERIEIGPGEG